MNMLITTPFGEHKWTIMAKRLANLPVNQDPKNVKRQQKQYDSRTTGAERITTPSRRRTTTVSSNLRRGCA
jgi:hypothetical protein